MNERDASKVWFKAKTYGYGWTPATWQGWGVLVVYLLLVLVASKDILLSVQGGVLPVRHFLTTVALLTFFLLCIAYKKGEPLKWRWGETKEHGEDGI